jgi:hypothetical protein
MVPDQQEQGQVLAEEEVPGRDAGEAEELE